MVKKGRTLNAVEVCVGRPHENHRFSIISPPYCFRCKTFEIRIDISRDYYSFGLRKKRRNVKRKRC